MKKFRNIAQVMRNKRVTCNLSQTKMASMIGHKNGQFISNIERSLCSIPTNDVVLVSRILNVDKSLLIEAMALDYKQHLLDITADVRVENQLT